MKFLCVFGSIIIIIWLVAVLLRLPIEDVPVSLVAFLGSHLVFVLIAWWAAQRLEVRSSEYLWAYYLPLAPCLVLAVFFVFQNLDSPWAAVSFIGALVYTGGAFLAARGSYLSGFSLHNLPPPAFLMLFVASVFLVCGLSLLVTLATAQTIVESQVRLAAGLFFLVQGAYQVFYVGGVAGNRVPWLAHSTWLPALMAILIFGWLAMSLTPYQQTMSEHVQVRVEAR